MTISNQLLLGIVFITAGVAMALLAYAAFLNRDNDESAEMEADGEVQAEGLGAPAESDGDEAAADSETAAAETMAAAVQPETKSETAPAETMATPAEPEPEAEPPPSEGAPAPEKMEPGQPDVAEVPVVASLRRDDASGRLVIDVDSATYRSMYELRASDDWKRVDGLFSDLVAWLYPTEPPRGPAEEPAPADADDKDDTPQSMIEQINLILEETLSHRTEGPQAVRLMEGSGGTIKVMIGVNSYRLEDVPDEEVKQVIRQAVTEWESRP